MSRSVGSGSGGAADAADVCGGTFYVTYEYDTTGNLTAIKESGSTSLATFGYDDLGRRTSLTRGNGVATSYGYDRGG